MRLLDLVEEHDAIRLATHGLRELAALLVTHVAGRCADEPRDRVLLHVFAHVHAHDVVLAVEQALGERARQLGFAHAGRPEKYK